MKNIILLSTLSILLPLQGIYAQKEDNGTEKNIRLKIVKEKDGKREVIEEQFKSEQELNEYLKEKEIGEGTIDLDLKGKNDNVIIHRAAADGKKGEKKQVKIIMKKKDGETEIFSDEDFADIMAFSESFKDKMPEMRRHLRESMKDLPMRMQKFKGDLGKNFHVFFGNSERDVTYDENLPASINQITKKSEKLELESFDFSMDGEKIGTYKLEVQPEDDKIGTLEIGVYDEAGKEVFRDNVRRDKEQDSFKKEYNFAGKKRGGYYVKMSVKGKTSIQKVRLR